jgi:hypothetical protein
MKEIKVILSKEKHNFFEEVLNFNLEQIVEKANNTNLSRWIQSVNGRSKGFAGEIFEYLITGQRGDNLSKPDFNGWEIKTIAFDDKGEKAIEKMSLTSVSYSTIENETYETSHVFNKSKIFVIKLTKNKSPLKRKFLGFGIIDLTKYSQVKKEYIYYRKLVCEGKANLFTSSAKILGDNQILHVRTAGTRKYKEYITKNKVKYKAKPYNFTLDYKIIDKLIKPILP